MSKFLLSQSVKVCMGTPLQQWSAHATKVYWEGLGRRPLSAGPVEKQLHLAPYLTSLEVSLDLHSLQAALGLQQLPTGCSTMVSTHISAFVFDSNFAVPVLCRHGKTTAGRWWQTKQFPKQPGSWVQFSSKFHSTNVPSQ